MAKEIRVDLSHELIDGQPITFVAPCNCAEITGLKVYYPGGVKSFTFKDAHGNDLTGISDLFVAGAYVKVIVDTNNNYAYIQNAATNKYLEDNYIKISKRGAKNGVASLDANGKVPTSQLPSMTDTTITVYDDTNKAVQGVMGVQGGSTVSSQEVVVVKTGKLVRVSFRLSVTQDVSSPIISLASKIALPTMKNQVGDAVLRDAAVFSVSNGTTFGYFLWKGTGSSSSIELRRYDNTNFATNTSVNISGSFSYMTT